MTKLNSNHVPTAMLLAYERYAAPLIFLGGRVYQNELLTGGHFCCKRDESAAEVQPTDVGFLLKRLFVFPTSVNQNRASPVPGPGSPSQPAGPELFLEREAVKAITATFASEGPTK